MTRFRRLMITALLLPVLPVFLKGGKGGGIEVTDEERANAEVAAENWNHYVTDLKPAVEDYVSDVRGDVSGRVEKGKGMGNADLMQKVGSPRLNPNKAGSGVADKVMTAKSGMELAVTSGVNALHAADLQGVLDAGKGKASTARAGMADIASLAAREALNENELDYNSDVSTGRTIASGVGMAAGMYKPGAMQPLTNQGDYIREATIIEPTVTRG